LLLVLCGALVYANALSGPFIYDDESFIEHNEDIRRLWPPVWAMPWGEYSSPVVNGRPLTGFTLALNYALGGLEVEGYHLFNIIVHLLCGLAFYGVVCRSGQPRGVALLCALLWLVHPLNSESVDYASQRSGLLMGLFYALAFYCAQRGMDTGKGGWCAAAVGCCLLSALGKEAAATAPLVILLYDRTFVAGSLAQALRRRWGLYAGLVLVWPLIAALLWSRPHGGAIGFDLGVSAWDYALNQCAVVVDYLCKVFWPHPLNIDYGMVQKLTLGDVWGQALLLALLGAGALWALLRGLEIGVAAAVFFIALAPMSSFVPNVTEVGAERRMYVPLMGLVVAVVAVARYSFAKWGGRRAGGLGALAGLGAAVALGAATVARNIEYRNPIELWASAVVAVPDNLRARAQLADALYDAGHLEQAVAQYDSALQLDANMFLVRISLGRALGAQGRFAEEAAQYRHILAQNPEWAEVRNSLGIALEKQGDLHGAIAEYQRVVARRPEMVSARFNLALVLEEMGDQAGALVHYRAVVAAEPGFAEARAHLAEVLRGAGALAEAVTHYERALALGGGDARLHNNYGAVLGALGRYGAALVQFRRALELDPDYMEARKNLAEAKRLQ
jgi:tetratricopeptide (TPR) repeat protein